MELHKYRNMDKRIQSVSETTFAVLQSIYPRRYGHIIYGFLEYKKTYNQTWSDTQNENILSCWII